MSLLDKKFKSSNGVFTLRELWVDAKRMWVGDRGEFTILAGLTLVICALIGVGSGLLLGIMSNLVGWLIGVSAMQVFTVWMWCMVARFGLMLIYRLGVKHGSRG